MWLIWVILILVLGGHCDAFVSSLQSENPDFVIGDTNVIVPSCIKGKLDAYLEADASQYVFDTISEGYKLIFTTALVGTTGRGQHMAIFSFFSSSIFSHLMVGEVSLTKLRPGWRHRVYTRTVKWYCMPKAELHAKTPFHARKEVPVCNFIYTKT